MYNPVNDLLCKTTSKADIKELFLMGCGGINAIADIMRCTDISVTNEDSIIDLGSALLILNGIVEVAFIKMEEPANE